MKYVSSMLFFIAIVICKNFMIKKYGTEDYITSSFNPISLPTLGPKSTAHIYEIAHPEDDSRISIIKLACVPNMTVIPHVVLDATKEKDKVTYFSYSDNLDNEKFMIIRYEDAYVIARGEDCITYNEKDNALITVKCMPKQPEQKFEIVEAFCSKKPEEEELEKFLEHPPAGISPIMKAE